MTFRICLILFIAICSSCNINVNLARRYKNSKEKFTWVHDNDVKKYVQVDFSSSNINQPPPTPEAKVFIAKSFFDLSENAQAELIKYSRTNAEDYDNVVTDLKKPLDPARTPQPVPVSTTKFISPIIKKSFQFKIQKGWYTPLTLKDSDGKITNEYRYYNLQGERINYLDLVLNVDDNSAIEFNSWDKYVSNWATIDLGKVSAAQTWNATLNLSNSAVLTTGTSGTGYQENTESITASTSNVDKTMQNQAAEGKKTTNTDVSNKGSAITTGGNTSIAFNDKYETSQNLSSRILAFSGLLKSKQISITQESGQGIDLSGIYNIGIEMICKVPMALVTFTKFDKFYSSSTLLAENKLVIGTASVFYPDIKEDIKGSIRYKYLYRKIKSRSAHVPEARQRVRYYYGELGYKKKQANYTDEVFKKYEKDGNLGLDAFEVILIKKDEYKPLQYNFKDASGIAVQYKGNALNFETLEEATKCMQYLLDLLMPVNSQSTDFTLNNTGLSRTALIKLQVTYH